MVTGKCFKRDATIVNNKDAGTVGFRYTELGKVIRDSHASKQFRDPEFLLSCLATTMEEKAKHRAVCTAFMASMRSA